MNWLSDLIFKPGVAHMLFMLTLAIFPGIILGNRNFFGIKIGIAGVLFSGLTIGALGLPLEAPLLHFFREFGLILFVFAVGLQVGPGFLSSFKAQGVKLNTLATAIILGGFAVAFVIQKITGVKPEIMAGLMSGAVTNTPGLGAAQQTIQDLGNFPPDALALSGSAYAVAYPYGIFGIILGMILIRLLFKISIDKEIQNYTHAQGDQKATPQTYSIEVTNSLLWGKPLGKLQELVPVPMVISRLLRNQEVLFPKNLDLIEKGDILQIVCPQADLEKITSLIGHTSETDVRHQPGPLAVRKILVSNPKMSQAKIFSLAQSSVYDVRITRVGRAGIEFIPDLNTNLNLGDVLTVVGPAEQLEPFAVSMGDSRKQLEHPNFLPIFIGIFLGVILGSIPLALPGLPAPVKLGMAGGPLLVALAMGMKSGIGKFSFYIPPTGLHFMREMGILLFLASVGLLSGPTFIEAFKSGQGPYWMLLGMFITSIPLMIVALYAKIKGMNYLTLTGLMSGSMTDPPALGYANSLAPCQAQSIAYATVYPLTIFLRVLLAQIFIMITAL